MLIRAVMLTILAAVPVVGGGRPGFAQQFVLPWEEAERAKPQVDPEKVETIKVELGKLEVRRLPVEGDLLISTHPEVADVAVEAPNLLFVIGRAPGETHVVIANEAREPVYTARIEVVAEDIPGKREK